MNLATAGRGLLHEGLPAGLVSADAASLLKALEIFGETLLILDVCILSVCFRAAIRRSGLSGAGSAFDRSERPRRSRRSSSAGGPSETYWGSGVGRSYFVRSDSSNPDSCRPNFKLALTISKGLFPKWAFAISGRRGSGRTTPVSACQRDGLSQDN